MRRTLMMGSLAIAAGLVVVGCGGGSGGDSGFTTATRTVAGFVYVRTDLAPAGSPNVVVTPSAVPPAGYAVPTAGTVTLQVANGNISRATSLSFNVSPTVDGNFIVARVESRLQGSGTPAFSISGTGISFDDSIPGTPNAGPFALASTNIPLNSTNDTQLISIGAPTYTPGPAASLTALVRDRSAVGSKFGAPNTVITSLLPGSDSTSFDYDVIVFARDANGVLLNNFNQDVTDSSAGTDFGPVGYNAGSRILTVRGGGAEGTPVTLNFTNAAATGLALTFNSTYTYGNAANFVTSFSAPSNPATLLWAETGPTATVNINFQLQNGRGVAVPDRSVSFATRDARSSGTPAVFSGNAYPAPAAGSILSATSTSTDTNGLATVTLSAPSSALGNTSFNGLNIKYGTGLKVDVNVGSTTTGSQVVTILRPLGSLSISGASRLDVGTTSRTTGTSAYAITSAADIDGQSVATPAGPFTWTITPAGADPDGDGPLTNQVGDPDNQSLRSTATPSTSGATNGTTLIINAGNSAGRFTVTASSGSVNSNTITTNVFGPPSKVTVSPTPAPTGIVGAPGSSLALTVAFLDGFGNDVTGETTVTGKTGSLTSSTGGTFTFPSAPSRVYNLTFPTSASSAQASMGVTLNWTGTGQGTTTGTATGLNITRLLNVTAGTP